MGFDATEIIMEAEDEFKIKLPQDAEGKLRTAADLQSLIVDELLKRIGPVDHDAVWQRTKSIIGRVLKREPATIQPQHHLDEDLGMD